MNSLIGDDLYFVDEEHDARPGDLIDIKEVLRPYKDYINKHYGWRHGENVFDDHDRLMQVSRDLAIDPFWSSLSLDELAKIAFGSVVQSTITDYFDRMRWERVERDEHGKEIDKGEIPETIEFIYKLRNSQFHYGNYPKSWNSLVRQYYAIPNFEFGKGFEVRFDHSRYFNYWGRAFHIEEQIRAMDMPYEEKNKYWYDNELYLDGVFAYLIYYKGRHVLTLGFSAGTNNILVCQVQLRNQKGNRWLYKLPTNYFDYSITRLADHFRQYKLDTYLVDGRSLADRIDRIHADDSKLPKKVYDRIEKIYNATLSFYTRGEPISQKMKFYLLEPK